MARVHVYKRSLNAVTTAINSENSQSKMGDEILKQIKQEPCNANDEDLYDTYKFIKYESEYNMPNDMSKDDCDDDKLVHCRGTPVNIIDNEMEKKALSVGHIGTNSRKRKRHDRHSVKDEDLKEEKRLKKSIVMRRLRKGQHVRRVRCKTCFLLFSNVHALYCHEIHYNKKDLPVKDVTDFKRRLSCNFCPRTFKQKSYIQAHLYHHHGADLGIDVDKNSVSNDTHNSHSGTQKEKKMRQTTLMEYMSSLNQSKCPQKCNNLNNSDFNQQEIIKQKLGLNNNQPFVKIHVDSNTMKILLGISPDQNDSSKPSTSDSQSSNSYKVYTLRSSDNSKKMDKTDWRDIDGISENINLLSICKKCTVPLVRCDNKSVIGSTSQLITPSTQVPGENNGMSLKHQRSRSRSKNVKPTSRISTPRNSIPKDSNSSSSTPKRLLGKNSPSKNTTLQLRMKKMLSRKLANRRSLYKQIKCSAKQETFSEEVDVEDLEALPSEEEPNLTTIQSTKSINNLKLNELRVSLIKLPEIKQELDTPNTPTNSNAIFHCTICQIPFFSERKRDKHVRKFHVAYISSICTARCNSKRYMLKHYLREHCIWGRNSCCVCRQFFRSRLLLKRHLLLHCIKVTLSKNEKLPSNAIVKCNYNSKKYKATASLRPCVMGYKEIESSQAVEREDNNDRALKTVNDQQQAIQADGQQATETAADGQQATQIQADRQATQTQVDQQQTIEIQADQQQASQIVLNKMQNSFEDNAVIYLSENDDYEVMGSAEEPVLDPLYTSNDLSMCNFKKETRITLTSNENMVYNENMVQSNVSNNNAPVSILSSMLNNTKQKFPCSICGQQFQKLESLWQHKRTYTQSLQNSCTMCGMSFSNRKILKNHINTTHNPQMRNFYKLHCQFCDQGFRTENNLRIHELHYHATAETIDNEKVTELIQISNVESNVNNFQRMCNVCGLIFNSYERYQLHYMYYLKSHIFPCKFCEKIFQGLYKLHNHNKLYHYPESTRASYKYRCPICNEGFTIETHFHGHMSHVHKKERYASLTNIVPTSPCYDNTKKSYVCSKCHLQCSTIMELMEHIENYSDNGNYQCQQCHRKCCTQAVLNRHINLTHSDSLRNGYRCGICGEVLLSNTSLSCHQKHAHHLLENLENFTVARETSDTDPCEIELNAVSDNEVLPMIGESDNEMTVSTDSVVFIHNSASPVIVSGKCNISCPICVVRFDKELYLKQHLAEYLDVGDYKCDECQRRFANSEFLRKHVVNHVRPGMSPSKYYCSVCNENFQSSIVYESHIAHLHARVFLNDMSPINA
ncbi:hypothetical protein KPH14_007425 [Odynerus spinipes]|uniref:C2H2-type domain-containing protein n=1 Tax=Odynerus spinipes TaxID=1348599 RepID=A0AAD9RAG7_9HYME|nr:hypothetical protein KPH14_007425 [Odynerus spinipes]